MFEADVTDVNGIGAIGGLGLEPAGGAIPLTGTNYPLTGGMSPEVLAVPTLGADNYDNLILGPEAMAAGPPIEANDPTFAETISEAVEVAIEHLSEFAADPNFEAKMDAAFGDNWDREAVEDLKEDWMEGQINLPPVEVISSGEIDGASGAFAGATNTIYLSRELLLGNVDTPDAVVDVLLEEFGHDVDLQINVVDAVGDEGDLFSAVVQGEELSESYLAAVRGEDDTAVVVIDGEEVAIEMKQKWNLWYYKNWQDDWGNRKKADWKGKASSKINGYVRDLDEKVGDYFLLEGITKEKFRANKTYIFNLDAGDDEGIRIAVKAPGKKSKYQWITPEKWVEFRDGNSKQYAFTPTKTGRYSVWFQYYEGEGDASVDISWEVAGKEPGNTMRDAYSIGKWNGKIRRLKERITWDDTSDYYRFDLTQTSDVSLSLNGLNRGKRADMRLIYNSIPNNQLDRNETIQADRVYSYSEGSINQTLGAGTYFVEIFGDGDDNTEYTLAMGATPIRSNTKRDPGNSMKTAYNLGRLRDNQRKNVNEFVGIVDPVDWYKFRLSSEFSTVSLSLDGLSKSQRADIELIRDSNHNGKLDDNDDKRSDRAYSYSGGLIEQPLPGGNYFVKVSTDYNTKYSLSLSAQ